LAAAHQISSCAAQEFRRERVCQWVGPSVWRMDPPPVPNRQLGVRSGLP
jgi:hypothetical protein